MVFGSSGLRVLSGDVCGQISDVLPFVFTCRLILILILIFLHHAEFGETTSTTRDWRSLLAPRMGTARFPHCLLFTTYRHADRWDLVL